MSEDSCLPLSPNEEEDWPRSKPLSSKLLSTPLSTPRCRKLACWLSVPTCAIDGEAASGDCPPPPPRCLFEEEVSGIVIVNGGLKVRVAKVEEEEERDPVEARLMAPSSAANLAMAGCN